MKLIFIKFGETELKTIGLKILILVSFERSNIFH